MNSQKIAFLICTNNKTYINECRYYIDRLDIPKGYVVEIHVLEGAESMTSGYNILSKRTDAEIKVYLHQDTFIINKYFIHDIISLFSADEKIGMIGMVGYVHCSSVGVMWKNFERAGAEEMYGAKNKYQDKDIYGYRYSIKEGIYEVCMADGFLLATNKNIRWDEENFDGWDFYDADQCLNYKECGYRIIVPVQRIPWCIHDDGKYLNLENYEKYRQKFLNKHKNSLAVYAKDGIEDKIANEKSLGMICCASKYRESNIRIRSEIIQLFNERIDNTQLDFTTKINDLLNTEGFWMTGEIFRLSNICGIFCEMPKASDFTEYYSNYLYITFLLRHIELFEDEIYEATQLLIDESICAEVILTILNTELYEKRELIVERMILNGMKTLNDAERLLWAMKLGAKYHTDNLCINVASMLMDYNEFGAALNWLKQIKDKSDDINELIGELEQAGV